MSLLELELTIPPPSSFDDMIQAMKQCEQMPGQTVYQHGESVWDHFCSLEGMLRSGQIESGWRIPDWFLQRPHAILSNLLDQEIVRLYTLHHDCGKPYCMQVDKSTGRKHFPNHAEVSQRIWTHVGGDNQVARLIGDDMVLHTETADEIEDRILQRWSTAEATTLLIVALAEVHSNSRLFGGMDTSSFKMKAKTIDRRGRQMARLLFL